MAVSDPTRKLLWSRAHNACAICKGPLTKDADSAELPGLVLGEEAHIIARSESGPGASTAIGTTSTGTATSYFCALKITRELMLSRPFSRSIV